MLDGVRALTELLKHTDMQKPTAAGACLCESLKGSRSKGQQEKRAAGAKGSRSMSV